MTTCVFNFTLGATGYLGDGPIILYDMIFFIDLLKQAYWLQTQVEHLIM